MRYVLGKSMSAAVLATSCLAAGGGVAHADSAPARTTSLYASSALVLTVGKGETPATAPVQRAVLLRCAPTPGGDHPAPREACAALRATGGDFAALTGSDDGSAGPGRVCTKIWDPVVVTADGVWEGRRVSYTHIFANECVKKGAEGAVFGF